MVFQQASMDPQPHLYFSDEEIEEEDQKFFKSRLEILSDKEIVPPVCFDWDLLNDLGIGQKLENQLRRTISKNKGILHIQPWFNMFTMQEPIYRELTLEFFSTVRIRKMRYHPC